jgi:hypothetical protein
MATIDDSLYLTVRLARKFMERHGLSVQQFLDLDRECGILSFLEAGYEPFHLTGDEGILDELDAYVAT